MALTTSVVVLCALTNTAAASANDSVFPPQAIRADFAELYQGLQDAHYNLYAHRPPEAYEALYRQTLESFQTPMTRLQIQTAFQKFVAYGRVAHAHMDMPNAAYQVFLKGGGKTFPLEVRVVEGRFYVAKNESGVDSLVPGAELVSLNRKPMGEWRSRLASRVSADTDYLADTLVEYWMAKLLWIELGPVESFDLCARPRAGSRLAAPCQRAPPRRLPPPERSFPPG